MLTNGQGTQLTSRFDIGHAEILNLQHSDGLDFHRIQDPRLDPCRCPPLYAAEH